MLQEQLNTQVKYVINQHMQKIGKENWLIVLSTTSREIRNFILIESMMKNTEFPSIMPKEHNKQNRVINNILFFDDSSTHDIIYDDTSGSTQPNSLSAVNFNDASTLIDEMTDDLVQDLKVIIEKNKKTKEDIKEIYNTIENYYFSVLCNDDES